ncbi:MAG: SDR family oxidoreductase [Balneolaceae bacterium]
MSSLFDLDGKLAVITGGGTGLGYGISKAFVEAGARIVMTGRRENKLAEACKKLGDRATYIVNDVTDLDSLPAFADQVETEHGAIDILVNNAGINMKKYILDITDEEFQNILQTNLNGVYALTREVGRKMAARESGSVIMITSMAAMYGIPQVSPYTASKTAVLGLTRSLAVELSPKGVRVNAIAPGFIDSPMLRKAFKSDQGRERRVLERTPMKKLGEPEDVACAAVYLASEASKFITGVNLPVDGGNSIGF